MNRATLRVCLGYGALAAAVLASLWLVSLAPLALDAGRELLAAAIALVSVVIGLRLARDRERRDAPPPAPPRIETPGEPPSPRERDVLALLAEGLSNKEIARRLNVSENTVKTHLANLYAKLGAARRTAALAAARARGWLD